MRVKLGFKLTLLGFVNEMSALTRKSLRFGGLLKAILGLLLWRKAVVSLLPSMSQFSWTSSGP